MEPPRYSLCYTTVRPLRVETAVNWWVDRAAEPQKVELILSTDGDRQDCVKALEELAERVRPRFQRVVVIVNNDLPGDCVKGWNAAAAASTGEVLIAISDDFLPPDRWDALIDQHAPANWRHRHAVLKVSDGYNPDLCTLAIITRRRYDRFGYLFYPGYQSMFSDTELTHAAIQDGVLIPLNNLIFEHLHPDAGKRPRDQVDQNHSSKERWKQGEDLFNFRRSARFPVDRGPYAPGWPITPDKYIVYMQAIRDDLCLFEVCERLYQEGARNFFIHTPDEYWSGEPRTMEDIGSLQNALDRLQQLPGITVYSRLERVANFKTPGLTRIRLETRVRNTALRRIRNELKFHHILIVDGDELWRPGLLARVLRVVADQTPPNLHTGMIPVIGLPAYPVAAATDKATVYIGPGIYFTECRGAEGHRLELPGRDIYHFTAVRRSRDEIVAKNRRSGHYDDPDYDFEGWNEKVLPNIKPGMEAAHMYKKYQVWPQVRAWLPGEIDQLPTSLHPFLGRDGTSPESASKATPSAQPARRRSPAGWPT